MRNNFRQFAFEFTATQEQAKYLFDMIFVLKRYNAGEIDVDDIASPFDQFCEMSDLGGMDFDTEYDEERYIVKMSSTGYGNIALVSELIKFMLANFDREDAIKFAWADSCGSPNVGEFHGGAMIVTKTKIMEIATYDILSWDLETWNLVKSRTKR